MFKRPNYDTLRQETGFRWFVGSTCLALLEVTDIPLREFNLNPKACIEAYRKGRPLIRALFGDKVGLPGVSTPPISYGHPNGLGSKLTFPEDGEVGHAHLYASLEEGIRALKKPVDFARAGMAPFYLDFRRELQDAFPDEPMGFGYGLEGPITTAYELRGEGFFFDLMDQRDPVKEFLGLLTESILDFHRFLSRVLDQPPVNPQQGAMCDDIASMVPPDRFRECVLPYWEQYYRGTTSGTREAHVEDLKPDQLPFLEEIGLSRFDPSISRKINPEIIAKRCRVPFGWRLGNFHYPYMTCADIHDFVFKAVSDGASYVFTFVSNTMTDADTVRKVHTFIRAAEDVEQMLDEGIRREEIGQGVSAQGQARFWDHWPE
ncbi:MAG: hypothetical protein V1800_14455 [Candidatus Latescibacterota bacterium]